MTIIFWILDVKKFKRLLGKPKTGCHAIVPANDYMLVVVMKHYLNHDSTLNLVMKVWKPFAY